MLKIKKATRINNNRGIIGLLTKGGIYGTDIFDKVVSQGNWKPSKKTLFIDTSILSSGIPTPRRAILIVHDITSAIAPNNIARMWGIFVKTAAVSMKRNGITGTMYRIPVTHWSLVYSMKLKKITNAVKKQRMKTVSLKGTMFFLK